MPYVPVPKDLTKVKTKVVLNLTARQLICFGGGAAAGVPSYFLTRGAIGNEGAALVMIGLALPFFLFGLYEKDGQPLEKRLANLIRVRFLAPETRPYRTENFYAALERMDENQEREGLTVAERYAAKAAGRASRRRKAAKKS